MKKTTLLTFGGALLLSLAACGNTPVSSENPSSENPSSQNSSEESESVVTSSIETRPTSDLKIISPTGAPTLAFYNKVNQLSTNSTPTLVAAQLTQDNYDAVVFDFYNGLKNQKANSGHYKLARIITAGNLVLVGINKTVEPASGDKIVSFGEGLLPDLAFRELYGSSGAEVSYVSGVSEVAPVLKSGKYGGEDINYVVIAEPVLTSTLATIEDTSIYTTFSIRDKWSEVKGEGHIIPQAGLFFNMNQYNENPSTFDNFLAEIDEDIENGIKNPSLIKTAFESIGDVNAQKEKFGIPAAMAFKVTQANNGVGLVEEYNKLVITNFLADIGKEAEDYSAYIL